MERYYVGVDVSKSTVDVALGTSGSTRRFPNTLDGVKHLCAWLRVMVPSRLLQVMLEPTSTYHLFLVRELVREGFPFTIVNPGHLAQYAKARGSRSKTDRKDALLLARFGEKEEPKVSPEPDEEQERMRSLRRHGEWLREEIARVDNRLEAAQHNPWSPAVVRRSLERMKKDLEKEGAKVARELQALVVRTPRWSEGIQLLTTIPGIGERTALMLLSEIPSVKRFTHGKQWVAYCGVDPRTHESGLAHWSALSRQGAGRIRQELYLPSISALRWNPAIRAASERLKSKGKSGRVRIMAAMNKLLRQAFAVLRSGRPYDPSIFQQATLDFQYNI